MNIQPLQKFFEKMNLFALPPRVNRVKYIASSYVLFLTYFLLMLFVFLLILSIITLIGSSFLEFLPSNNWYENVFSFVRSGVFKGLDDALVILGLGIPLVVFIYHVILLRIRRFNDINFRGWWCLLCFIPVLNIIVELLLSLIPGSKAENKFGPKPAQASNIEYFVVIFIFLSILLLGIVGYLKNDI